MPVITEQPKCNLISRVASYPHFIDLTKSFLRAVKISCCDSPYLLGVRFAGENTFLVGVFLMCGEYLIEYQKVIFFGVKRMLKKGIPSNNVNEVKHTSLTGCYSLMR